MERALRLRRRLGLRRRGRVARRLRLLLRLQLLRMPVLVLRLLVLVLVMQVRVLVRVLAERVAVGMVVVLATSVQPVHDAASRRRATHQVAGAHVGVRCLAGCRCPWLLQLKHTRICCVSHALLLRHDVPRDLQARVSDYQLSDFGCPGTRSCCTKRCQRCHLHQSRCSRSQTRSNTHKPNYHNIVMRLRCRPSTPVRH